MSELDLDCDKCRCINGVSERPWQIRDLGLESRYCPKKQITPFSWWALQLYGYFQSGHLPFAGGVADQPHKLTQAFAVISDRREKNLKAKTKHGKKAPR